MQHLETGIETELFCRLQLSRGGAPALALLNECLRFGGLRRNLLRHRLFRSHGYQAGAKDRVRAGRIDFDFRIEVGRFEAELQALTLADPVFLHGPDLFRPLVERPQTFEQFLGEIGDLEEPLRELALLDQRARAPASPVDHLLIGKHGLVDRVPVDRRFLAVDETAFVEIEEQRLFVAVVLRLAGGEFAAPVERETKALELRLHVGDVLTRPATRVHTLFHGGVLGGHTEGIPTHRVQDLEALHPLVAREHVTHRVIAHVADVDAPRRIGEHLEDVAARLRARIVRLEALRIVPRSLPARVRLSRIEPLTHVSLVSCGPSLPAKWINPAWDQPPIELRRRSRARVRMMSSSFCTVAA